MNHFCEYVSESWERGHFMRRGKFYSSQSLENWRGAVRATEKRRRPSVKFPIRASEDTGCWRPYVPFPPSIQPNKWRQWEGDTSQYLVQIATKENLGVLSIHRAIVVGYRERTKLMTGSSRHSTSIEKKRCMRSRKNFWSPELGSGNTSRSAVPSSLLVSCLGFPSFPHIPPPPDLSRWLLHLPLHGQASASSLFPFLQLQLARDFGLMSALIL